MPDQSTGKPCATCGRRMVTQRAYRANPAKWRARGYVRHGAGPYCNSCDMHKRRDDPQPSTGKPHRVPVAPIDPAIVAQLRAAAGLPVDGAP